MRDEQEVRDYFGRQGFKRFLSLLERQYRASQGGPRGYVTLSYITEEEREALDSFYETYSPPRSGESRRYSIRKFDQLLSARRFSMTIPELLALLRGEPIYTRREQEQLTDSLWRAMIEGATEEVDLSADAVVAAWAASLADRESPSARVLSRVFARSADEARSSLAHCLRALLLVRGEGTSRRPIRLPIVSARVTGDAHAFDWKNALGRLFWWGLRETQSSELSASPEEEQSLEGVEAQSDSSHAILIRDSYRRGGVADDDLSSHVLLYAPSLYGEREERVLTLRQVEQLSSERLDELGAAIIYAVENPSVFAEIIDTDRAGKSCCGVSLFVVCMNGQPTTAVLKLLDLLLATGSARLFYAGDLDPAGMTIASGLQQRYGASFHPWRMDREQYLRYADRGIPMMDNELARLREMKLDWAPDLVATMRAKGAKLHQELWVEELAEDVFNQ